MIGGLIEVPESNAKRYRTMLSTPDSCMKFSVVDM